MISPCRITLLPFLILSINCFEFGSGSYIPEEEARIIRSILQENGYSIGDNESVDNYLEITSSNVEVDLHDRYWLVLPDKNKRTLFLSDKINELTKKSMFLGIKAYRSSNKFTSFSDDIFIDSINIISDSVISLPFLYLGYNKIKGIPPEIGQIRAKRINFSDNQISTIPEELTNFSDSLYYQNISIDLDNNKIDTLLLSDTLKSWLAKYAYGGENWWKSQEPYRYTAGQ